MSEQKSADRYFPAFDSLRALGFVAVVAAHVNECYGGPFAIGRGHWLMATVFGAGWMSLDMFFVMSGFLITGILYEAREQRGYFRNFYARRALRIMPVFYVFLAVGVAISWCGLSFCEPVSGEQALSYGLYYSNFRFPITRLDHPCFIHFWSLAVEEHFYLLWPLLVWKLRRETLMRICVALAAMSFLLRVGLVLGGVCDLYAYFITPCRLDGLFAGSFVALARKDRGDWIWLRRWSPMVAAGSGCLLLGIAFGQRHIAHYVPEALVNSHVVGDAKVVITVGILAAAVFFASFLVVLLNMKKESLPRRVLDNKWLCAFGTYSYGMYLCHYLVMRWVVSMYPEHTSDGIAKLVTIVCVTAISFAAAWLSYHSFEKRLLKLKRYFEYRQPAQARPAAPPVESGWSGEFRPEQLRENGWPAPQPRRTPSEQACDEIQMHPISGEEQRLKMEAT